MQLNPDGPTHYVCLESAYIDLDYRPPNKATLQIKADKYFSSSDAVTRMPPPRAVKIQLFDVDAETGAGRVMETLWIGFQSELQATLWVKTMRNFVSVSPETWMSL